MSAFDYLCRICATDTKGRNSFPECVYIMKTEGLREKMKKYLDVNILETDEFPKTICKKCYRTLEGIVTLTKIASQTEQMFTEFLTLNLADIRKQRSSEPLVTAAAPAPPTLPPPPPPLSVLPTLPTLQPQHQIPVPMPMLMPSMPLMAKPPGAKHVLGKEVIAFPEKHVPLVPLPMEDKNKGGKDKDEVVVNVSVTDPLTRETQQKKILASARAARQQQQQHHHPQQQQPIVTNSTPKSIAQRSAAVVNSTPKQGESLDNHVGAAKKSSPSGVITFFHGKSPQQQPQVTTFTSGGYVIEPSNGSAIVGGRSEADKNNAAKSNASAIGNSGGESILKPRLKTTKSKASLLSAINTGQVSLLKSSQRSSTTESDKSARSNQTTPVKSPNTSAPQSRAASPQLPTKTLSRNAHGSGRTANKNATTVVGADLSLVDELPNEIIIASVKKPKTKHSPSANSANSNGQGAAAETLPQSAKQPPNPSRLGFPEDILLGRVIKDADLLKLILKALKWSVNEKNMEGQMSRLRSSRFADIMSDPNLLHDNDLSQLLAPYIAPVIMAAQALQQQHMAASQAAPVPSTTPSKPPSQPVETSPVQSMPSSVADLASAIPYRLPPETSVQLVPASPEEERPSTSGSVERAKHRKSLMPVKKSKAIRQRDSIVISDEEDNERADSKNDSSKASPSKQPPAIDPRLLQSLGLNPASLTNVTQKALLEFLGQQPQQQQPQKQAPQPQQEPQRFPANKQRSSRNDHNKRKQRSADIVAVPMPTVELDDIILVEPDSAPSVQVSSTNPAQSAINLASILPLTNNTKGDPIVTRPIIKRRKTVIQSSGSVKLTASKENESSEGEQKKPADNLPCSIATKVITETAITNETNGGNKQMDLKSGTEAEDSAASDMKSHSVEASHGKAVQAAAAKKLNTSKSALGQQLLEAIGLQKIPNSQESAESNNNNNEGISSKDPVSKIRLALKDSLKKAQQTAAETMKSKQKTVIQDADSTTKSGVKEVLVEATTKDAISKDIDLEEHINKVLLQSLSPDQKTLSLVGKKKSNILRRTPTSGMVTKSPSDGEKKVKFEGDLKMEDDESSNPVTEDVDSTEQLAKDDKKQGSEEKQLQNRKLRVNRKRNVEKDDDAALKVAELTAKKKAIATDEVIEIKEDAADVVKQEDNLLNTSNRPSRASKANSKYYKGPEKLSPTRSTRSTRSRY